MTLFTVAIQGLLYLIAAASAAFHRDKEAAKRNAHRAVILAAISFAGLVLALLALTLFPSVAFGALSLAANDGTVDPSQTARALAEGISEIMNVGCFAAIVAVASGVAWWRTRSYP